MKRNSAEGEKVKVLQQRGELWTKEEEERLRQLFLQHAVPGEIAQVLGRTVSAVKSKAHALGITIARFGNRRRRGYRGGVKNESDGLEMAEQGKNSDRDHRCSGVHHLGRLAEPCALGLKAKR